MFSMEIPYHKLSHDVLRGIIAEFVLREGTDYGLKEYTIEEKIYEVLEQLKTGSAKIIYCEETETFNIEPSKQEK